MLVADGGTEQRAICYDRWCATRRCRYSCKDSRKGGQHIISCFGYAKSLGSLGSRLRNITVATTLPHSRRKLSCFTRKIHVSSVSLRAWIAAYCRLNQLTSLFRLI